MPGETTARAVDPLQQYLNELGEYPLLTAQQEIELSQRIEAGTVASSRLGEIEDSTLVLELQTVIQEGEEARQQFINSNLRLVVSIAKRYPLPHGMELLDLIQEGNLGLEHAVTKFDWRKGFKFSTYASFWIKQAIGRALDQKGNLIHLPGNTASELRRTLREYGEDASAVPADVARLCLLATPISLSAEVGDEESTLQDFIAGGEADPAEESTNNVMVANMLSELSARERLAIELRFGFHGEQCSYAEIGKRTGLSTEIARRLINRTMRKLSNTHANNNLADL